MKKQMLKSALIALAGVGLMSGVALATPTMADLAAGTMYQGLWPALNETGAELVALTDTDGNNDSSTSALKFALGGYSTSGYLTFGIFDYDTSNNINVLPLFNTATPFADATVTFSGNTATYGANSIYSDGVFGFYIYNSNTGKTFYTVTALNTADNKDHALIYDTDGLNGIGLQGATVVVAFEDLLGGGDLDYDDVVVGVTDVTPVPEPATMLLFGTGLIGIASLSRRKK